MDDNKVWELLGRLDERGKKLEDQLLGKNGTEGHIPRMEKHLETLNDAVARNSRFRVEMQFLFKVAKYVGVPTGVGGIIAGVLRVLGVY